jgi:hypothetical protein
MNRCHRIGQKNSVQVTLYYTPNTVEERILAWRSSQGEPVMPASQAVQDCHGGTDELSVLSVPSATIPLHRLHYFLGIGPEPGSDEMRPIEL